MEMEQRIAALNTEVVRLYNEGNFKPALPLSREAFHAAVDSLGEEHPLTLSAINNAAALLNATHHFQEAERFYTQALSIVARLFGESDPQSVLLLHNLARCYRATGRYREMEPTLRRALDIARQFPFEVHPDQVVQCLNTLADAEENLGRYAEAEAHLEEASTHAREALGEGSIAYAQTLQNLSTLLIRLNRHIEAEPLVEGVLGVIGSGPAGERNIYFARSLHTLALVRHRLGHEAEARGLLERAVAIKRDLLGDEDPDVALSLSSLASMLTEQGRYAAAEPLYRKAVRMIECTDGPQAPDLPGVLEAFAALLHDMGDLAGAESHLQRAIGIREALGQRDTLDHALLLNGLALVYLDQRSFDPAEAMLRKSLRIRREVLGEGSPGVGLGLNNLAGLYWESGDWARAERCFRQAVDIQRSAPNQLPLELATSLANLALLLQLCGRCAEAEPLYREALAIRSSHLGKFHPSVSLTMNNIALLLAATGEEERALEQKSRVEAINDHLIGEVFSAGSERQRMLYLETFRGPFFSFLTLVADKFSGSPDAIGQALDLVQKRKSLGAEVLGVQRDSVLGGRYPDLQAPLHRLNALRHQIANKTLEGPGPEAAQTHAVMVSKWRSEVEELEKDLAQCIPEMNLARRLQEGGRHAIAAALEPQAALVEFVHVHTFDFKALPAEGQAQWGRTRYLAFVLHAGNPEDIRLVDVGDAEKIDRLIAEFRSTIAGGDRHLLAAAPTPRRSGAGTALRAALFDPLIPALSGCRRVVIAPDGDLTRLPFESLPARGGRFLLDDYVFSYVTVGRDLLRFHAIPAGEVEAPVVVAYPDYDLAATGAARREPRALERESGELRRGGARFDPLPGTLNEGQRIGALLGVKPLLGPDALEGRLRASRSPRMLHIATHGFFLSDPESQPRAWLPGGADGRALGRLSAARENPLLRSGLALAGANTWLRGGAPPPDAEDGILTAADVTGLNLLNTELVVLSACDTGLGEVRRGEGVFGLRRAFVQAGARTLVMSLWKVPDQQTQELMLDFYQRLLQGDASCKALRQAQLAMKSRHPNPIYWAAFICQGDAGFLRRRDDGGGTRGRATLIS